MHAPTSMIDPPRGTSHASAFGDDVVACDPAMMDVLLTAKALAQFPSALLITGETGSGKEVVARVVHRFSPRNGRPWVDVNCAALPENLVESELFGHERGAYSGADVLKPGLFELAHGGTLFLDEIGDIDPRIQVKLLRVLDTGSFYRLGGTRKVSVDVHVIAATNRDLEAAVAEGTFRRDLFHRITELLIRVPPLRERPSDIAALAAHFLRQIAPHKSLTDDALDCLTSFPWPGNARELRNVVTKLGIMVPNASITGADIRHAVNARAPRTELRNPAPSEEIIPITEMERRLILSALESTGGNQSRAAERLGMPRRTFCRKLDEYQIGFGRSRATRGFLSELPDGGRIELRTTVQGRSSSGKSFTAEATDLSSGGIGLAAMPDFLQPGDELRLQVTLPGRDDAIDIGAAIVWCRPDGTAGAQFRRLRTSDRKALQQWLAKASVTCGSIPSPQLTRQIPA